MVGNTFFFYNNHIYSLLHALSDKGSGGREELTFITHQLILQYDTDSCLQDMKNAILYSIQKITLM